MGLKIQVYREGDDCILVLPDEICEQLGLEVGDTMAVNYDEEEGLYLRKVDVREEWPDQ